MPSRSEPSGSICSTWPGSAAAWRRSWTRRPRPSPGRERPSRRFREIPVDFRAVEQYNQEARKLRHPKRFFDSQTGFVRREAAVRVRFSVHRFRSRFSSTVRVHGSSVSNGPGPYDSTVSVRGVRSTNRGSIPLFGLVHCSRIGIPRLIACAAGSPQNADSSPRPRICLPPRPALDMCVCLDLSSPRCEGFCAPATRAGSGLPSCGFLPATQPASSIPQSGGRTVFK